MKLAEKNDPKEDLKEKSMAYKSALEQDVKLLSDRTGQALTNILIVTGALGVSYVVYKTFFSSRKKSKSKKKALLNGPQDEEEDQGESKLAAMMGSVGTVLATQATAFLLAIAREKLIEYLKSDSGQKEVN